MHVKSPEDLASILGIIGSIFAGIMIILRAYRSWITNPMEVAIDRLNESIKDLRNDLTESRNERIANERETEERLDEHAKKLYEHDGYFKAIFQKEKEKEKENEEMK